MMRRDPDPTSHAMHACTGGLAGFSAEQVEEVRMVVRMLPVFCATILFWTIYAQARLRSQFSSPAVHVESGPESPS